MEEELTWNDLFHRLEEKEENICTEEECKNIIRKYFKLFKYEALVEYAFAFLEDLDQDYSEELAQAIFLLIIKFAVDDFLWCDYEEAFSNPALVRRYEVELLIKKFSLSYFQN